MQRVVHVSGSPGSGKTSLGKLLTNVDVVDTDDLISDEEGVELSVLRDAGKHDEALIRWKDMFLSNLWNVYRKSTAKTLVFTGILNHWSPDGSILEMPFPNVEKYFIDIQPDHLVRQFYLRYGKEMRDDAEFWSGVAEGRYNIPSSIEYLAENRKEKEWHVQHGYKLSAPDEIAKRIQNLCKVCGSKTQFQCRKCELPYCSTKCQQDDWKSSHKLTCNNPAVH